MKMLDTNVCSYLLRAQPRGALARIGSLPMDALAISALVAAELRFGAAKRQSPGLSAGIERFLQGICIRPWPIEASTHYAHIRATLEREGQPVGNMDLLIAAHALAEEATLLTNNVREFERVPKLRVERWE
jgi:tRNA(fMet)-specific endonuclease VapC